MVEDFGAVFKSLGGKAIDRRVGLEGTLIVETINYGPAPAP
jgi:hypothetical protein